MFNEYLWQLYLDAGGEETVAIFERGISCELTPEYAECIKGLHEGYCPSKVISEEVFEQIKDVAEDSRDGGLLEFGEYTTASALNALHEGIKQLGDRDQDVFRVFSGSIEYFSTFLAIELPDLFVPYYFRHNFNVLEMIAQKFDISLPEVPVKKDYKGRFYYYGRVCEALLEFREQQGMSPYELCAFLYDFAPKYLGGTGSYIIDSLPEPKSAYFIGGSKDDAFWTDDSDTPVCWQCNPDTRAGDAVVMYLKTPTSAVDSVWRSVSVGFNDPFFYYYRCTYIANAARGKRVSLKRLKSDKVFKEMPIVRKNMQGINGVEIRPSEYNRLLDLMKADAPRLEFAIPDEGGNFVNEKDVEDRLVKWLLRELGYSEKDYKQQLYVEVGNRSHMLIPDFVVLPVNERGLWSAFALVEVKHSISSQKELKQAWKQAASYARQLKARYSVIASQEKVWVYASDDDFTEEIFGSTWGELKKADVFSGLLKLVGRDAARRASF